MKTANQVLEDLYEITFSLRREHCKCPELNASVLQLLKKIGKQVVKLEKELEAAQ